MKYFLKCWRHYADFKGRARRKEYWMFILFNYIISLVIGIVYYIGFFVQFIRHFSSGEMYDMLGKGGVYAYMGTGWVLVVLCVGAAYTLAAALPSLALIVRRLHDIGRKGTWLWLMLVPIVLLAIFFSFMHSVAVVVIVGFLLMISNLAITVLYIVLGCIAGQNGENQYGPDPKLKEI